MADTLRYVDTGAVAGGDGTTYETPTVNDGHQPYQSLSQWEAAEQADITGTGGNHVVHCRRTSGGGIDTAALLIYTWTTDATHRIVVTQDDFPEDGVFDNTKYVLQNTNTAYSPKVYEEYVTFRGVQIEIVATGTGNAGAGYYSIGAPNELIIDSCIIQGTDSSTGNVHGLYVNDADAVVKIYNTVIAGFANGVDSSHYGLLANDCASVALYQCTISGCYYGMRQIAGTVTAVNCAVFNNTDDFSGTFSADHCASDDGDGTNAVNISPGGTEADDWAAAMPGYADGDFRPAANSVLVDAGTDLSGTVDDDIIGTTRPQNSIYDIGAFEATETAPATSVTDALDLGGNVATALAGYDEVSVTDTLDVAESAAAVRTPEEASASDSLDMADNASAESVAGDVAISVTDTLDMVGGASVEGAGYDEAIVADALDLAGNVAAEATLWEAVATDALDLADGAAADTIGEGEISGTACWGHVTDVLEDNALAFSGHWTGTGAIAGSGDGEYLELDPGEYMESDVVHAGAITVDLAQNVYASGDAVPMKYRTGDSAGTCAAAEWQAYSAPFESGGYVQIRVEG